MYIHMYIERAAPKGIALTRLELAGFTMVHEKQTPTRGGFTLKPSKVGMSLLNAYAFVLFGSLIDIGPGRTCACHCGAWA